MYEKIEKIIYNIEKVCIMIPFIAIFVTVVIQVFQRFFNLPIVDTSDISLVSQAVFTFLSAGMLVYLSGHITIEVHKLIKNKNVVFIVELVSHILMLVIGGIFIYLSYDLFLFALSSGTATMALRVPLWIPYGAMLLGMIFLVIHTIGAIIKLFYYKKNPSAKIEEIDIESLR